MPYLLAVCGVRPNCAKTGMPESTSARTTCGNSAAASILIRAAAPSRISRLPAASAAMLHRPIGHVAADQRARCAAPDRLAADQHFLERDVEHVGSAPEIDADRVADRDEIEAGAIGNARNLIIPSDEADAFLPFPLH